MDKRLFLGITLTQKQTQQMTLLQSHLAGYARLVAAHNLHMTLLFLGNVSEPTQRQLEKLISAMHKPKFKITLDTFSHWKKPKIFCISGQAKDNALLKIVNDCQLIAATLNLHSEEHAYTPHITLARKAQQSEKCPAFAKPIESLILNPKHIELFESKSTKDGVQYTSLRVWKLQ